MTAKRAFHAVVILLTALLLAGCLSLPMARRSEHMVLETLIPSKSVWTAKKVLLVSVDGAIDDNPEGGLFSEPGTVVKVKDALKHAEKDPSIYAILLRVNSPGGTVTASDILYTELKRFKERTGKKIVAVFLDVAASGGYYTAMCADRIVAHPTTVTGSIGVIATLPSLQGLSEKIGVEVRVIKSGNLKDMGSLWRGMSSQERELFQGLINGMYERFLTVVQEGRPKLDAQTIRNLADGRVYTAQQALEKGLVDQIGYIEDAFESAKSVAGIGDASLVTYTYPFGYRGNYYASAGMGSMRSEFPAPAPTQINLLNLDLKTALSGFRAPLYYLWVP